MLTITHFDMFKLSFLFCLVASLISSCQAQPQKSVAPMDHHLSTAKVEIPEVIVPVKKTAEEWKAILTDQEYYILRKKGTERAFTGPYWDNKAAGIYTCRACDLPLFDSATKYKSGTGWPSFWQPLDKRVLQEDTDYNIGYKRTEILCSRCGGHLGHVFEDGPEPTGLRYCMNGTALRFIAVATSPSDK